jgi:hypothetical protein
MKTFVQIDRSDQADQANQPTNTTITTSPAIPIKNNAPNRSASDRGLGGSGVTIGSVGKTGLFGRT